MGKVAKATQTKNVAMTLENHKSLYEYHKLHPKMSHTALAAYAQVAFNLNKAPNRTTIGKSLAAQKLAEEKGSESASLLHHASPPTKQRLRKPAHPAVEEALIRWIQDAEKNNIAINWKMICTSAKIIADKLNVPEKERIKFTNGWQDKFRSRYGIKIQRVHRAKRHMSKDGGYEEYLKHFLTNLQT